MEHTFELTDTVPPTPYDSPLTGSYTPGSNEGRLKLLELMNTCNELSNRITTLQTDLSSTKVVYHKAFITLTKRVKKLETRLKQKRSGAVIHFLDEEEPSLDVEDSSKQGRMIGEIDKDETINLVSEKGEVQETAEPLKDDDDATYAKTLLNIKRSTTKDKGKAQKLHAEELAKETARQEHERNNLEKALELQKQLDQRKEDIDKGNQTQDIDWNDPEVLRYHALQNKVFSKAEVRKNMCTYLKNQGGEVMKRSRFNLQQESSKKQKLDEQTKEEIEAQADTDQEVEEMKLYVKIVLDEDIVIDVIPLATKPPVIVEYKIVKEGKISTYHTIRADGSTKRYTLMIKLLENIDREDLEMLWKLVKDKHGNTRPEEDYERVLSGL
nr:hypothetical protein [Tanacetum cinerariifolium]